MPIPKILDASRVSEVDSTIKRVIALYNSSDFSGDIHITGLFTELKVESKALTRAIIRIKDENELDGLDGIRDNDFRSLYFLVLGKTYSPDQSVKEKGQLIFDMLGTHHLALIKKGYSVESSLIDSILAQLDTTALHAVASLPDVKILVENLKVSQSEFVKAQLALEVAKAKRSHNRSASVIKKDILPLVNGKVLLYIDAMGVVDEANYGTFASTTAQIIHDNNRVVKKRLGK